MLRYWFFFVLFCFFFFNDTATTEIYTLSLHDALPISKVDEKVMVKLIVEGADERILGMHMVGKDAAEIIQSFAPVLLMNGTKADLDRTMALHPSTAEEFVTLR